MFTSLLESNTTMSLSSLLELELELDMTKTAQGFPPGTFWAMHFVLTIAEEYMEMYKNKNFNSRLSTVCHWSIAQQHRQNWVHVSFHTPRRGGKPHLYGYGWEKWLYWQVCVTGRISHNPCRCCYQISVAEWSILSANSVAGSGSTSPFGDSDSWVDYSRADLEESWCKTP